MIQVLGGVMIVLGIAVLAIMSFVIDNYKDKEDR